MNRIHRAPLRAMSVVDEGGNLLRPDADGGYRRGQIVLEDEPAVAKTSHAAATRHGREPAERHETADAGGTTTTSTTADAASTPAAEEGSEEAEDPDPPPAAGQFGPPPFYGLAPVLSVEEAARFLRLNAKSVYASIAARELPGRKVGRRTVVLRDALLQWLRSNERVLPRRGRSR